MSEVARTSLPDDIHPSPHRHRSSRWALAIGLWLAPVVWYLQMSVDTWAAGRACYPFDVPFLVAQAPLASVIGVADAVAIVLALIGAIVAWRTWQATKTERSGHGHTLLASGEGRTRFLAMAGMLTSGLMVIAMVYAAIVHAALAGCGL